MRGLTFVDVPLEVWMRFLSVVCFGNYFYINTRIHESSFMCVWCNFGVALSVGKFDLRIMTITIWIIKCRVYFLYILHLLHIWTFVFLNNSVIGFYYFTSFGFFNFWILVFSLLSFLLSTRIKPRFLELVTVNNDLWRWADMKKKTDGLRDGRTDHCDRAPWSS